MWLLTRLLRTSRLRDSIVTEDGTLCLPRYCVDSVMPPNARNMWETSRGAGRNLILKALCVHPEREAFFFFLERIEGRERERMGQNRNPRGPSVSTNRHPLPPRSCVSIYEVSGSQVPPSP